MSHHANQGPPPEFPELLNHLDKMHELRKQLGATGQFPEGKLTPQDEGEIKIAIYHQPGKVVIDFGDKPIKWIGFSPVQARQIAMMLMEHADECLLIKS